MGCCACVWSQRGWPGGGAVFLQKSGSALGVTGFWSQGLWGFELPFWILKWCRIPGFGVWGFGTAMAAQIYRTCCKMVVWDRSFLLDLLTKSYDYDPPSSAWKLGHPEPQTPKNTKP